MTTPLWMPSEERKRQANITRFIDKVNAQQKLKLASYPELYQWSVENIPDFWAMMWDFAEIKASRSYDQVIDDLKKFPTGAPLTTRRNGTMVKLQNEPTVYYMENGIRRAIPDPETLNAMKLDWSRILIIAPNDMQEIPKGPGLISKK